MGWKASCILINEREPGYLGSMPRHDPDAARRLITDLGLGRYRGKGMTTFDEGIFPDHLVVGSYDGAAVIGDRGLAELSMGENAVMRTLLERFKTAEILQVGLHSVVNYWSYEFYNRGRLIRAYGGSADEGVVVDFGTLLPEERPHFDRSEVRDGERVFFSEIDGVTEEFDPASIGEEFVFGVMARFFGCSLVEWASDESPFDLEMESFELERSRRWWWPFSTR